MTTIERAPEAREEALRLRCMEVFGSNRAERREVSVPGIDAVVHAEPYAGAEGGGDIHYISQCMAGAISRFLVADVAGHGGGVDELATTLRRLTRKHINTPDQTKLTRDINEEFARAAQEAGRFATAVLATYFAPTDSLIVSNAGHPPPMIRRAGERIWSELTPESPGVMASGRGVKGELPDNLPLGIIEPTQYAQFATRLQRGDAVVLYTDSFTEAADPYGEQLGQQGLASLLADIDATDARDIADNALDRLARFRAGNPDDDLTLMVLTHNGANPPKQSLGEWIGTLGRLVTGH